MLKVESQDDFDHETTLTQLTQLAFNTSIYRQFKSR